MNYLSHMTIFHKQSAAVDENTGPLLGGLLYDSSNFILSKWCCQLMLYFIFFFNLINAQHFLC